MLKGNRSNSFVFYNFLFKNFTCTLCPYVFERYVVLWKHKRASCPLRVPGVTFLKILYCQHCEGWQLALNSWWGFSQVTWLQVVASACKKDVKSKHRCQNEFIFWNWSPLIRLKMHFRILAMLTRIKSVTIFSFSLLIIQLVFTAGFSIYPVITI